MAGIPRKIKRLLKLILLSEGVYFLFYWALQVDNFGFTVQSLKNVLELEIIWPYSKNLWILLPVFAPPLNGVFWFVGSLAVVYGCFYFVLKYRKQKLALIASVVCVVLGFLLRRVLFYTVGDILFPYEQLLPFLPFPFFVFGYYFGKYQQEFDKIHDGIYHVALIAGIVLTLIEQRFGVHTLYIGTFFLVFSLLALTGKHRDDSVRSGLGKLLSHIGEKTGTYIYMLHMIVINVLQVMLPRLFPAIADSTVYLWIFPLLVCVASAVAAEVFARIMGCFARKRGK